MIELLHPHYRQSLSKEQCLRLEKWAHEQHRAGCTPPHPFTRCATKDALQCERCQAELTGEEIGAARQRVLADTL